MEEKIALLKQIGFSDQFIDALKESDSTVDTGLKVRIENQNFESLNVKCIDSNELVIDRSEKPQHLIINTTL